MKKIMLLGLLYGAVTSAGFANEEDGIFSFMVGRYQVYMIVESERDGNAGILVGADEATLKQYVPENGFKHSANVFLIKMPRQNVLIDTGTGAGGIVIEKLKKLGVQPKDINAILLTHLHGDHFGGLQRNGVPNFPNAKIYLSAIEHDHFTKTNVNQGAVEALNPYGANVITFEPSELGNIGLKEILPGIIPIAAYGHTPGHTIYMVQNRNSRVLIAGDLLHVGVVQFPVPEINASYDIDPRSSAVTRRRVLEFAFQNRIGIGGMHIAYPGIGQLSLTLDRNGYLFNGLTASPR